jgi:hypothetical protein
MKKKINFILPFLIASLAILLFASCNYSRNKTSVTATDGENTYQFKAKFNKRKTEKIRECIDRNLGDDYTASFTNANIKGNIVLQDDTKFYLQTAPGLVKLKFNKNENTEASYFKIKKMCEEIKQTVR